MGYRVGYQCFISSEAAHDYLLSMQPPVLTADGKLIRPVKDGGHWYLQGQKIQLSFPECNIAVQITEGLLFSGIFFMIAVLVFGINKVRELIESVGSGYD